MKCILVQVLGINFAGTNFAYLLSKIFRFTLCCFCSENHRHVCLQMFNFLAQRSLKSWNEFSLSES